MRLRIRPLILLGALFLLAVASFPLKTLQAQDNTVTVTLGVPSITADNYSDQLLSDFATAHPGITVKIVKTDVAIPNPNAGLDAYFTALQSFVNAADVLYIDPRRSPVAPVATNAGYFLDLTPLVNGDKSLNVDDFYPTVWQSFQWDKGIWALPTSTDAQILSYDAAAFDKAGIAYPSDKWTLDDLVNAINKLTVKDSSGKVTTAGLGITGGDTALFRSLLGEGLYDANSVPNLPKIDTDKTEALLTTWLQLQKDGLIGTGFSDFQNDPISIGSAQTLQFRPRGNNNNTVQRTGTLLPGGKAGLTVQGFAVSAGTEHPEQAYALASFLTTRPELAIRGGIAPARKSLVGAQSSNNNGAPGGRGGNRNLSPEVQALVDNAVANGLPTSETRYAEYLDVALTDMKTNNTAAKDALQTVQQTALQNQQAALTKKSTTAVTVATPIPDVVLVPGKVKLNFSYASFVNPLPNQDKWDQVIKDFIASDPQVGDINFDTSPRIGAIDQAVNKYDCFYLAYNAVPTMNLGLVLNLDPFLSADSTFDKTDVVGNVMAQLQRDNKTWAFPIIIQPSILKYNSDQFNKNNVPAPTPDWTVDVFNTDLKALKPASTDPAPFIGVNTNGTHLLILMAANGGIPLDFRTNPPVIDFTSQKNVDAIQQVLDLAKQGYIQYNALSALDFGGGGQRTLENAIYTSSLNAFARQAAFFGGGNNQANNQANAAYKNANYPQGTQLSGLAYSIGTAYISAKSQNPEACYRWISTISRHPELFSAMPARRSLINESTFVSTTGADTIALYNQIDKVLQNANTVSFPSLQGAGGSPSMFLLEHWLYEAFDNYVLNNADLASGLKDAEGYAKTFQGCTANIPAFDPATQTTQDYNKQFATCATKADSRLATLFNGG